jgi:hypothetical protein
LRDFTFNNGFLSIAYSFFDIAAKVRYKILEGKVNDPAASRGVID